MKLTNRIKLSAIAIIVLGNIALGGVQLPVEQVVTKAEKDNSQWYIAGGLVAGQAKASDCEDKTYGFIAKVGYDFSEYIGVEVRGFRTNWDYEGGKLKHLGAFLKPQYSVSKDFKVYGLAGYAKTSMGNKRAFSDTGLAYGAGLDYALTENFGIFADYERLVHDAGVYDLDALSLGLSYGF